MESQHICCMPSTCNGTWQISTMLYAIHVKTAHRKYTHMLSACCLHVVYVKKAHEKSALCGMSFTWKRYTWKISTSFMSFTSNGTWKISTMLYVICIRENGTWKINTMFYVIHVKTVHGKLTLCFMPSTWKSATVHGKSALCCMPFTWKRHMKTIHYVVCRLRERGTWKVSTMLYYAIYVQTGHGKSTIMWYVIYNKRHLENQQ